jgi:hypothetical protein
VAINGNGRMKVVLLTETPNEAMFHVKFAQLGKRPTDTNNQNGEPLKHITYKTVML